MVSKDVLRIFVFLILGDNLMDLVSVRCVFILLGGRVMWFDDFSRGIMVNWERFTGRVGRLFCMFVIYNNK